MAWHDEKDPPWSARQEDTCTQTTKKPRDKHLTDGVTSLVAMVTHTRDCRNHHNKTPEDAPTAYCLYMRRYDSKGKEQQEDAVMVEK